MSNSSTCTWLVGRPRSRTLAMAASGSLPIPMIRPRRNGFLPSLAATLGALCAGLRDSLGELPAITGSFVARNLPPNGAAKAVAAEVCKKARRSCLFMVYPVGGVFRAADQNHPAHSTAAAEYKCPSTVLSHRHRYE